MNRSKCPLGRGCRGALLAIIAFGVGAVPPAAGQEAKPAEPAVRAANHAGLSQLPFANRDDYQDAARGFMGTILDALVTGPGGNVVWSHRDYGFLDNDQAPDTVNPSLWRQAQLNHRHGLFKVVDGLYQIRGFDISNMTVIEGITGLVVIDRCFRSKPPRLRSIFITSTGRGDRSSPSSTLIPTPTIGAASKG